MLPKILQPLPLAAIAVFGLLLVFRAFLGPLSWPVQMNSPLNAESWCALAAVVAFAVRARPRPGTVKPGDGVPVRWPAAAALLALVALAYARALGFYFLSDDFIIVELGRTFRYDLARLLTTGGGDGFFRPVGYISLGLTGLWAGGNPVLWHAATLAVHFVNTLLVLLLARRLTDSRTAAILAAVLFAIHGTRPEVAVWIAGRFDLAATFFVLAGLVLFLRGGAFGKTAAFACMVLGILSKESAYAFPLLLVLLLWARGERTWRPYAGLAPFFAAAAALVAYRWVLFGGIGGYPASFALLPALKALLLRVWAALFFPLNWGAPPGMWIGVLLAVYVAALLGLAAHRGRFDALLPVGFVLVASLPPLNQLLIAADLQKSRMLYLPSVGFCLLLGGAIARVSGRRWRVLAAAAVVVFHLGALEHNLSAWATASDKVHRACVAAAQCGPPFEQPAGLPGDLHGVPFFANGFGNCVSMHLPAAAAAGPGRLKWDAGREELVCEAGERTRLNHFLDAASPPEAEWPAQAAPWH